VSGLVYKRLVEDQQHRLPDELTDGLRNRYARNVRNNLRNASAVARIDASFARNDIRALLVKGMALIDRVYRDPGLRPMSDVDLVIWPPDEKRAIETLGGLGYTRDTGHPTVFSWNGVTIDLKPDPFGIERIQSRAYAFGGVLPALWQDTERLGSYRALKTWSAAARCYTLTIHAVKHGFPDGMWLSDLGETFKTLNPDDCARSKRLFATTGNNHALSLALMRIADWGYERPALAAGIASSGSTKLLRQLSRQGNSHAVEVTYLLMQGHLGSLRESFFPNEAVYRQGIPKGLKALRYLLRVLDVAWTSAKALLSRTQGV
jgi:hypothetical protein